MKILYGTYSCSLKAVKEALPISGELCIEFPAAVTPSLSVQSMGITLWREDANPWNSMHFSSIGRVPARIAQASYV